LAGEVNYNMLAGASQPKSQAHRMKAMFKRSHGKPGPKPRGPYEGKRETITTRITPATRQKLDQAAAAADRSLSQEIELRLDRSFDREDGLGGHRTAEVLRKLAHLAQASRDNKHWLDDDATFNVVLDLWERQLRKLTPPPSKPIERRIKEGKKWIRKLGDGSVYPEACEGVLRHLRQLSQDTTLPPDTRAEFAAAVAKFKRKDDGDLA
jgi:hypothetical protein